MPIPPVQEERERSAVLQPYRVAAPKRGERRSPLLSFVPPCMPVSMAAGVLCLTNWCAAGVAAVSLVAREAIINPGGSPADVFYAATVQPFVDVARGVWTFDVLTVAATVVGLLAVRTTTGVVVASRLRRATQAAVCRPDRVVCVSSARFGQAARHIADAQRAGAPRLLRVNRTGVSQRRAAATGQLARVRGVDRDEYPPAFARSVGQAVSVRYIDPFSN